MWGRCGSSDRKPLGGTCFEPVPLREPVMRLGGREDDSEPGALTFGAFNINPTTMLGDNLMCYCQSQTSAVRFRRIVEIEYLIEVLLWYAGTGVIHDELNTVFVSRAIEFYRAARRCCLECILQKI